MATQKSGNERQTWHSSSSSLLKVSTNSLTKSVNGPLQCQSNRSKTTPSKRSVTPNPRVHSSSAIDADRLRRSVTPTSTVPANVDHEPFKNPNSKKTVPTFSRVPTSIAHDPGSVLSVNIPFSSFLFFSLCARAPARLSC